jgi:acyl-CoA thioesterase I
MGCLIAALGAAFVAAAPSTNIDTRPVIVAFGDSLSAGFGAEPGKSFPDFLQRDLDASGLKWRIVNAGVSGNTTTDGLDRVGEVLAHKPRITIVEFGGNDGLRGLPLATTRANLEQIIQKLQAAGSKVLLAGMTLPPNYGVEYITQFGEIYVDLAKKFNVPRIPFLLSDVAFRPGMMQQDGIHPTAQGNEIVAMTVMKYLRPMLKAGTGTRSSGGPSLSTGCPSLAQFRRRHAMAFQAQGADVIEIAFASAFYHRNNVIGIP